MNKLFRLKAFQQDELLIELAILWFDGENIFKKIGTAKINDLWKNIWFAKGKQQIKIDKQLQKFDKSIDLWYNKLNETVDGHDDNKHDNDDNDNGDNDKFEFKRYEQSVKNNFINSKMNEFILKLTNI